MTLLNTAIGATVALASMASMADARHWGRRCRNPIRAVKETLRCIGEQDADCASSGYSPEFAMTFNGEPAAQSTEGIHEPAWWNGAFGLLDFQLDVSLYRRIGRNKIIIRYIESVTTTTFDGAVPPVYPFGQTLDQHEDAIITLDNDCKITGWDMYGDSREQEAVADIVQAIVNPAPPVCQDADAAVLRTIECVNTRNATCAAAGYSPDFVMTFNGELAAQPTAGIDGEAWWNGAFALLDFQIDVNYQKSSAPGETTINYIETVTSSTFGNPNATPPFGVQIKQHELAHVKMDSNCKIVAWDMFGDQAEQDAVANTVNAMIVAICTADPSNLLCQVPQ